ncbi:MAG: Gfo/Idh/MocA family oxidoreductase [Acidimicrobiales bacterium]|nr:Gfo/Idh/MocA family oxidoreductase [Acidimicrobiales bacterium]MYG61675.1 Gfo/Idh/MocA family oxidoreductase [Acidimicrobiales bacterium]MYJ48748.1 Gfo/Idh/MocA family oxidoreductase [Acidimicrobiales bacterium]
MRFGVIGTGMMGIEHIANVIALDGAEVSALCDNWEPSLKAAQHELACHGLDPVPEFENHQDLLDAGLCDAVVVATPNHLHTDIVLDVAAACVPQLVEKPLATTLDDCRCIIDGIGALGADTPLVWVGLEYRYMAPVAALISQAHAGTVGQIRMVAIREHRFPFQPKVRDWNRFNRNTGGTLVEKCCHFFDLMRVIVPSEPVRVMASGAQDLNHLDERYGDETPDILDNAFVIVDFASGARALLDLCMFADATRNQEELSVVGDDGKLEALIPDDVLRIGVRGRDRIGSVTEQHIASTAPVTGHHHGSSYIELERFCDAVLTSSPAECTLADGLWSVAIGRAAHISIDEGRPVQMSELLTPAELGQ